MNLFGFGEAFEAILPVVIIGLVIYFVYKTVADKIPAIGKKVKPLEDLPRDALDRVRRDLKKSARLSKPFNLRYVRLSGDEETPGKRLGTVWGLSPRLDYHIIFYKPAGRWFMKMLMVENEFCSDARYREMVVRGRGIDIHGILFQFVEPVRGWRRDLGVEAKDEVEALRRLWLRRISAIQVMVEKQSMVDRIEIRSYLEHKAVLPKVKIQDIMQRGSRYIDKAEGQEDW